MDLQSLFKYLKGLESKTAQLTLRADDPNLPTLLQDLLNLTPDKQLTLQLGLNGITPKDSTLTISGAPTDPWIVPDAPDIAVALSNLTLTISAALAVSGKAAGSLTLAAKEIGLEADYIDKTTGWRFCGGTADGVSLKIGDLISDLTDKFGIGDVPQPINSLNLTKLSVTYETGTGKFNFECDGDFKVSETPVKMKVTIDITSTQSGSPPKPVSKTAFGGKITLKDLEFDLIFNTQSAGTNVFVASYSRTQSSIKLKDLVNSISSNLAEPIPSWIEIDLKDVNFIFFKDKTEQFAFGLDLGTSMRLANLPLVGDKLPSDVNISVNNLQFLYSSEKFDKKQVGIINQLLPATSPTVFKLPADGMPKGIDITAVMQFGTEPPRTLSLGNSDGQTTGAATGSAGTQKIAAKGDAPSGDSIGTKWFDVQKQFGIFQFKRIGVGYESNILLFSLDAALTFGPLMLSMDGLSFGSPLDKFDPTFGISGLGLTYNNPPLEIAGAFLNVPKDRLPSKIDFQFDGAAILNAEEYSLAAVGSYAQMAGGEPSLFIFAQLESALGGPAAFFVTGLMAGFGFNRKLEIPAQDEVLDFPFLASGQYPDPMKMLDILEGKSKETPNGKQWIHPSSGDYWLAVGVEFTSFELVYSKALLIVEFGNDFQVVLLGLSTMRLPKVTDTSSTSDDSESYAYVEMQLKAVFRPQDGFFGLAAILSSNSYVISKDCHLTGGYAFYVWFGSNENAGQFVITMGGYHPAFTAPDYFPQVPRLGFNWAVSDSVTIKGDAYYALTTSCIMAGGGLEILYQDGDLSAWFTAHTDLLISWHPFFFTAEIDVEIGASYRLNLLFCHKTISVSVGATVEMWGPPTGGSVRIHLSILSFTVYFGSDGAGTQNESLEWSAFKTLLPDPGDVCKITISTGLYKMQDSTDSTSGKAWVIRAGNFGFFTQSIIPASQLQYTFGTDTGSTNGEEINIRPMNLTGVTSTHHVQIYNKSAASNDLIPLNWTLTPRTQNVPGSLWGTPPNPFIQTPAVPSNDVLQNRMVGYTVQSPPPVIGPSRGVIPLKELAEDYVLPPSITPLSTTVAQSTDYVPIFDDSTVGKIELIMKNDTPDDAGQKRDALYAALKNAFIYNGENGELTKMARQAGHIFSDSPMRQIYEKGSLKR